MTRQTWVLLMNPRRSNLSGLSVSKFPGRTVGASFFDPSKQRLEKLVGCERRAVADDDHFSFCPRQRNVHPSGVRQEADFTDCI